MDGTSARALHRNAAARSVIRYPELARVHSRAFVKYADIAVSEQGMGTPYSILWGESEPAHESVDQNVLPEWFRMHNALCATCMCPLVPGITSQYKRWKRAWSHICGACGHAQPKEELKRPKFPSVRARRHGKKAQTLLHAEEPVDAVAATEARMAAEARESKTANKNNTTQKPADLSGHKPTVARKGRTKQDSKAGLREMLAAQKKNKEPVPRTGGLADFLSQL